jgi:Rrf2 family protein
MTSMASHSSPDARTRVEDISDQHPIPDAFLLQIFQTLKRSGLVQSKRGAHGGFQLARPPEQIFLSEIIESVEGKILPSPLEERADLSECPPSWRQLDAFWDELRGRIRAVVETYSLADLVEKVNVKQEGMYYI